MAKVGTISIDLIAHTGKLLAPLKRAESAVKSLSKSVSGVGGMMLRWAAPITGLVAGFLSVRYAINKVTKAFEEIGDLAKESDRLGIPTEKLVALQHAAASAGVDAENLGSSLQYMMKQGFAVDELDEIADRLAGITDPVERMQYALKTFGKSGSGMINVLAGGSKGLKDLARDAQLLGLAMTRLDAQKVDIAGSAFARIGLLVSGIARKLAIELSPFIKQLADDFVAAGTAGEGMSGAVRRGVDGTLSAIGWVLDAIKWLSDAWEESKIFAQVAMVTMADIGAFVVKGFETAAESIVGAFGWMGDRLKQIFIDLFAWHYAKIADFIAWLDSYLPASMQTGLGEASRQFAETYAALAEESRKAMEDRSWEVDLNLGADTARAYVDTLMEDVQRASDALVASRTGRMPSEKLKEWIDKARDDIEKAAAEGLIKPPGEARGPSERPSAGAFERGSVAAMKAITDTQKTMSIETQQLAEQKRMAALLAKIERGGVVLRGANFT